MDAPASTDEHGCEFVPVAGVLFYQNALVPLPWNTYLRRGREYCCIHCLDFTHTSMLAYFQVLYHTSILLKRQTLKKIKKTTNNIKIIN